MASESIWKEKEPDKEMQKPPQTAREIMQQQATTLYRMEDRCKHYDNGRCYSPFAHSNAIRCRGSIGCYNFEIIW